LLIASLLPGALGAYARTVAYRWVEHTGELELELEADTLEGVFEEGFVAMRGLLAPERKGPPLSRRVELEAPDRAALLADWLAELAFLAETEGLVPERLTDLRAGEHDLVATVEGRQGHPPHLVKAATYHRLSLDDADGAWRARVILDV
jgi:SHS2 domain-containing protein